MKDDEKLKPPTHSITIRLPVPHYRIWRKVWKQMGTVTHSEVAMKLLDDYAADAARRHGTREQGPYPQEVT